MSTFTDLEYVEGLELDVLALFAEQIHHQSEVRFICDVARHDIEVGTIEQDLSE